MPVEAPRNNLPQEVVQVLSFHGLVELVVDPDGAQAADRVSVAPFEDLLYLLVPGRSPAIDALLKVTAAAVQARHPQGEYSLRLAGIARAGQSLARHPQRQMLEPWLPENVGPGGYTVVEFAAWRCEFTRTEGEEPVRYHGPTPLGRDPRREAQKWLRALFGGIALLPLVFGLLAPFGWLVWQGETYPQRWLAMATAAVAVTGLVGGTRLLLLTLGFVRWRAGAVNESEAPVLSEGLLAPAQTRLAGVGGLGAGVVALAVLASHWADGLVWVAGLANLTVVWGPAWLLHLLVGKRT